MKKILVVIPTFNPNDVSYNKSFENFTYPWFNVIRSWRKQRNDDLYIDIVIADNVSGEKSRRALRKYQLKCNDFYINFINDFYNTPYTPFNLTLAKYKNKDSYDYYCYCSSDVFFNSNKDLQLLLDEMDNKCCFILPYVDNDMIQRINFIPKKSSIKIQLGNGVNMHMGIMKKEFLRAYNYKLIDIIGGGQSGAELFYPYQCAAIGRHILLSSKVCMHHIGMIDRKKVLANEKISRSLLAPQYKRNFSKMLDEGMKIGLGFNEVLKDITIYKNIYLNASHRNIHYFLKYIILKYIVLSSNFKNIYNSLNKYNLNILPKKTKALINMLQGKPYMKLHNPNFFDKDGYAKNKNLYRFIKKNLYLTNKELRG